MLAGNGAHDGWAQIGYIYYAGGPWTYFTQWKQYNNVGSPNANWYGGSPSATHSYRVNYVGQPPYGNATMYMDGIAQAQTGFDPTAAWSCCNAEWNGETFNYNDEVPGNTSAHVHFGHVQEWSSGSGWHSVPGAFHNTSNIHGNSPWVTGQTGSAFDLWGN